MVRDIYHATKAFPREEMYGLTSQIRRAAVSVPSNIAEGYGRGSLNDYMRFLQTARGSLLEVQTQVILAVDLEYIPQEHADQLWERSETCSRILQGLIRKLASKREAK